MTSYSFRQSAFGLYWGYVRLHLYSFFQYKGWILGMLPNLVFVLTDPLDALLMFDRFGAIGDWTASMVMLVYGLALAAFGLSELFARGFDYFPMLVRDGSFDRILLRPRSPFLQAMTLRFHLNRLNRVVMGVLLAALSIAAQGVRLTFVDALMLLFALLAGILCYTGVFLLISAVCFFTIQPMGWINVFTNGSYQVAKVPPRYLPAWMRNMFIFVMPMFLFSYYPAASVCRWDEPYFMGWLALPAGLLFFGASALLWRVGVRHYKSTGS